jgi:hypothetical protein
MWAAIQTLVEWLLAVRERMLPPGVAAEERAD